MRMLRGPSDSLRRTPGFTLFELLIVCFCTLLLADILFFIFVTGNAIWRASITRTADTQELQVADLKMAEELEESDLNTVTNNTGGSHPGFSFLSARNNSGVFVTNITGAPVWQKYVIYCVPAGTTRLVRNEVPLLSLFPLGIPSPIPLLTSLQVSSFCSPNAATLSSAVSSLSLSSNYNTFLNANVGTNLGLGASVNVSSSTLAVNLLLGLRRINTLGKIDNQTRTITIYMRNSGLIQ